MKYKFFGNEKPIPDGRKLLVTEEAMGSWLASHWGLTIDTAPAKRHPEIKN